MMTDREIERRFDALQSAVEGLTELVADLHRQVCGAGADRRQLAEWFPDEAEAEDEDATTFQDR